MEKNYKLAKDLPFAKAGTIFKNVDYSDIVISHSKALYEFRMTAIPSLISYGWIEEVKEPAEITMQLYEECDSGKQIWGHINPYSSDKYKTIRTAKFREVIE